MGLISSQGLILGPCAVVKYQAGPETNQQRPKQAKCILCALAEAMTGSYLNSYILPAGEDCPSGVREEAVRVLGLLQPHHQNLPARRK